MDQFDNLPEELKFLLVGYLSDIDDISKLEMISRKFKFYVTNISNNSVIDVLLETFSPFINLEHIDHKIIVHIDQDNINYLDNLRCLRYAHLYIDDITLLLQILSKLSKLRSEEYYFKISCDFPQYFVGIFLKNKKYLVMPNNYIHNNVKLVVEILHNSLLDVSPIYLPDVGKTKTVLTSNKMKKFLQEADLGLVDSNKPLSPDNLPVNKYTRMVSEVIDRISIVRIVNLYRWNETRKQGKITETRDVFEKLGQYFGPEIPLIYDTYTGITRNLEIITQIIHNNVLGTSTTAKMVTHNLPDTIPNEETISLVNNIVKTACDNQMRIEALLNIPGTTYYTSEGREVKF